MKRKKSSSFVSAPPKPRNDGYGDLAHLRNRVNKAKSPAQAVRGVPSNQKGLALRLFNQKVAEAANSNVSS